jgi:multiple sugar transport system substrate-binding protein
LREIDRQQRLAVVRAEEEFSSGGMSRREFIRFCGGAGFGFSSLYLLGGCRSGGDVPCPVAAKDLLGPRSACVEGTEQQRFLKEVGGAFRGKTVRVVSEATPPSLATRKLMFKEFIPLTGIDVQWEVIPLERVLAKVSQDTSLKLGRNEIFYLDQAWIGRFAHDTIPPQQLLEKSDLAYPEYEVEDFLPPLIENVASYNGETVAIPYDIPIFIMMYRRDIFEELGLKVPKTMAEYLRCAKAINEAKAPGVFGTTAQWKSGHYALECNMTAWLWGHGGSVFGSDGRPTIDDERAEAAMEYMLELGKYMPPGVTNWDWNGEIAGFAQGMAGFYISWGEFFPICDNPSRSKIVGLAEAAPCPKEIALRAKSDCGFCETPGISHQGGSSMAVSRYAKEVEPAWIFLQWATSSDVLTRACLLGGGAGATRKSTYEDPRVKEMARVAPGTTRHLDVTLDAILNRMGTEPHLPEWTGLAVDGFAVELGRMTTGQQDIKTTLKKMARAADMAVRG